MDPVTRVVGKREDGGRKGGGRREEGECTSSSPFSAIASRARRSDANVIEFLRSSESISAVYAPALLA
jgi:hypothetical protein